MITNPTTDYDLAIANYDSVVAALESMAHQCRDLSATVKRTGVVSRDQVQILNTVSLESLNPNAFTARPSITGVRQVQAALEDAEKSLVSRLTQSLKELLLKVWQWVLDLFDRREANVVKLVEATEEIAAIDETLEEIGQEPEPTAEQEQRFEVVLNAYTDLTKLTLLNEQFSEAAAQLIRKLPAQFSYMRRLMDYYVETMQQPLGDETEDYRISIALKMIRNDVIPSVRALNKELHLPGLDLELPPLDEEPDGRAPSELVMIRSLRGNAAAVSTALSDSRKTKGVIHTRSEMDQMLKRIDRLADMAAQYRNSIKQSKEISAAVLEAAKGFDMVAPISDANFENSRHDENRMLAEMISGLSQVYRNIERGGDLILNDALAFINSVRSFQNARVKEALSALGGQRASALRTKLAAKLEEIRDKQK